MARKSESGHHKKVARFKTLKKSCTGFGAAFNPSADELKLSAQDVIVDNAVNILDTVKANEANYNSATNARAKVFKAVKAFFTRIINAVISSKVEKETIADAKRIVKKVRGIRATKKVKVPEPVSGEPAVVETKTISVSQLSFDSQIDHLKQMIELVSLQPKYAPNEVDLTIAGLKEKLADMEAKNDAAIGSIIDLTDSRLARNKILYAKGTGLCDIAQDIKAYVKSMPDSAKLYKRISKLSFEKIEGDW